MAKKVMSKSELLERREEIIAEYGKPVRKSAKRRTLTKKERKVLGIGRNEGKATLRHLRMNAFKVNALIKQVKGKSLEEAYAVLLYTPHGAAQPLTKLLKSAEANAVNNNGLSAEDLYVAELYAMQGPTLKRIRARAKGQATWILKRTCHVHVVLKEKEQEV
ncbi:MAG TPA: 50S ribosomal protein L22 [Bacillota bacterium]|nr:50S ribosomal protein L22 [Clostridiaceae bacterium]HPY64184.1 50S ribosomal protein L22 [Bacillota bacterium]HQC48711.1 50S ribosomal protein L22 [Bacillota bacterium]